MLHQSLVLIGIGETAQLAFEYFTHDSDYTVIAFAVDDAAKCSGKLDGIVAVAGILSLQEFTKTDDAIWHNVIDTNLSGSFYSARAAIPHLQKQAAGSIVFVSSQIGLVGHPLGAAYAASKAGINGLTKSTAVELAPNSIRVNAVAPGTRHAR